jgi:hypothetical protein
VRAGVVAGVLWLKVYAMVLPDVFSFRRMFLVNQQVGIEYSSSPKLSSPTLSFIKHLVDMTRLKKSHCCS